VNPAAERAPGLDAVPGLVHRFYGRTGGFSRDAFSSLNLSAAVGDDANAVARNWSVVGDDLDGLPIARMRQVHGGTVATARRDHLDVGAADGMSTGEPGLALAVLTADCVPILMAAPRRRVVMALHAGWRGTAAGIAAAAVARAHDELGVAPEEWLAALGPSIAACCYEVGTDVAAQITARWGAMPDAWSAAGEKGRLDLRLANRHILIRAGVPATGITFVGSCTACAPDRYFSHRQSKGRTGRQLSVIAWGA
jgi:YfiH family protein